MPAPWQPVPVGDWWATTFKRPSIPNTISSLPTRSSISVATGASWRRWSGKPRLRWPRPISRGYYHGEEIHACEEVGITPFVSKPITSLAKANGRFDKEAFVFEPETGEYQCPACSRLIWRFSTVERGALIHKYWSSDCPRCAMKEKCTPSTYRRVARGEFESSLEAMQKRLDKTPEAMRTRRQTVEHPFGTLKDWMGATHFLTRTLERVSTEMSLHVLAFNLKRVMKIIGIADLNAAMKA